MFGYNNRVIVVNHIDWDPAADDYLPLFRAPVDCEVLNAYVITTKDVAASTANYFQFVLCNGGAAGTATTAISGTVGGTAGWTGLTPKSFTVADGTVTAGHVVTLKYDEEGDATFDAMVVQLEILYGVGEDA